jgi:demethoxyubiquinone hydroxylase (CLK1/Coq7/Cat5 family)
MRNSPASVFQLRNKTVAIDPKSKLILILQSAHSGEVAAAYAYRGHWKSLRESPEKQRIKEIEAEEWDHRRRVGEWLAKLDAKPRPLREKIFWTIGRVLGLSCYLSGWFMPMYFAGRLESKNSVEYEDAAVLAKELEMQECLDDLLDMARVELEHELFFREVLTGHRLLPMMKRVFGWS